MDVEATHVIGHLGFRIDRVGISLRKEIDDLRTDVRALRDEVTAVGEHLRLLADAIAELTATSITQR